MGYTLIIGDINGGQIAEVTSEQAPAIEGAGPHSRMNKSQPSYAGMEDLCSLIGLRQMFFEELLVKRPGVAPITARHARAVSLARQRYQRDHPQAQPRYEQSDEDGHLARLVWLEWWMQWALEHCHHPGIQNS
jgi:hypothetical protein